MKLTRILIPKNCIQKKINKRTTEKLRHVEIYDLVNKKDEACTAFVNLEKEFPKAPQNLKERARRKAEELACPK